MLANDTQLYVDFSDSEENAAMASIQSCRQDLRSWFKDNFLLLNDRKTKICKFGQQYSEEVIQIGSLNIATQVYVTSLGRTQDVRLNISMDVTPV